MYLDPTILKVHSNEHPTYKIIMLGDTNVGKTNIFNRLINGTFTVENKVTIGVEFATKILTINDSSHIKIQLWDTAGQERYKCMTDAYYRYTSGIMIIYDITNRKTFDQAKSWITDVYENRKSYEYGHGNGPQLMLIGNKLDLADNRQVDRDEARDYAIANSMLFAEISALDETGIYEAFHKLVVHMVSTNNTSTIPEAYIFTPPIIPKIKPLNMNLQNEHKNIGCCGSSRS